MDDPNQIEVPPSFTALFSTPGGYRLTQPVAVVRERYELCEDMAQMLTQAACARQSGTGASQREVLDEMARALAGPEAPLQEREASWVVRRLAELLEWDAG